MAGIITQVTQAPVQAHIYSPPLTRVSLDLRGKHFSVDHETIMALPESVLLCLFPNGIGLSSQATSPVDLLGGQYVEEEQVYGVDFDPDCFSFVLQFFRSASDAFYGTGTSPGLYHSQQHLIPASFSSNQNPLLSKQAIIVLQEELEYFSIPPKGGKATTDANGIANESMLDLKRDCGRYLLEKRCIFTAPQRNVNKENNVAGQHLIDMLCMSGFDRDAEWGFRTLEPSRCCIASTELVLLKTGIVHHPAMSGEKQVTIDYNQMATAQKVLLFWRKPARKCWWDGIEIELKQAGENTPRNIKLWARRVWTLELCLV